MGLGMTSSKTNSNGPMELRPILLSGDWIPRMNRATMDSGTSRIVRTFDKETVATGIMHHAILSPWRTVYVSYMYYVLKSVDVRGVDPCFGLMGQKEEKLKISARPARNITILDFARVARRKF